ncbi:LysR family transcriptional regulator [Streptoalloteichus hindustanus]|uniref:DNA-binding transcriptional regulator, LysR family n=1 Tax=Streptoalloteichus hindustanus TaxID=2017 RepID=A0A1M5DFJ5_STRHI|nr:LysR substrate-binding domain-containing protein [Streptoalloteichus hindustanus]SHF65818.1 DNA-binding transcriptional regulator, LysR family [Streptoalloteichus hindustanus]
MDSRLPERHELEAFLVLAEELHFGRTAERLRLSQARVSQTIRKLERAIGAPLFERTSRRVALTPIGARLREDLAPLHRAMGEAIGRATAAARGVDGVLRLGFLGAGAGELTPTILETFRARHPGCEIQMRETHFADPLGPLRAGEVDLLLTRLPVEEPDLTVGPVVLSEPRVLAVPARHPLARRRSVSLEDLARHTVFGVVGPAPDYWWDFHVPPTTPSGKPVPRGQGVATFQELLALVAAGQGISPVAASVTRYYPRPDVVFVPFDDAPPTDVAVVWRTAGATARTRAFVDAVEHAVRGHGGPARH